MTSISKSNKIIFIIVCIIFGFFICRQFYLNGQINKVSQVDAGNAMALEVTDLIKTNENLRKQIDKLNQQKNKLDASSVSSQASNETLQENLQTYKIILGLTDVQGPGVEIIFADKLDSTQVIDLVNAVKNIGAESITINNNRFGPNSYIETGTFNPPTTIQVIGDADVLKDSLVRPGGIIEQIGNGNVEKKDNIYMKSL